MQMTTATFAQNSGARFGHTHGRHFPETTSSLSRHVGEGVSSGLQQYPQMQYPQMQPNPQQLQPMHQHIPYPGVQQPSSYVAAKAMAAAQITNPSIEPVPASATQQVDPYPRRPHSLVQPEDCEFFPVFANSPPDKGVLQFGVGPAVHRGQGPTARRNSFVGSQQVYVQDAQNASEFKPVAQERARRVYGVGGSSQVVKRGHRRLKETKNGRSGKEQSTSSQKITVPALWAISLDRDALYLGPSRADEEILEVLVNGESWLFFVGVLSFACQCALAGVCFLHAGLAFASRPKSAIPSDSEQDFAVGANADVLADVLLVLEPYLTGFTKTCAEIGFIGAILRVFHAHDRATTKAAIEAAEAIGDQALTRENLDELELRQEALSLVTLAVIGAVCNLSVAIISYVGMANTFTLFSEGREEWNAAAARLMLGLRAGFGMFAFFPATLELMFMLSLSLPELARDGVDFASLVDEAKTLEEVDEAKTLEEESSETWPGAPPQNEAAIFS